MPLRRTLGGSSSDGTTPIKRRAYKTDTKTLQVACFGMGSSAYDIATFCKPAKDVFKYLLKMGAWSLLKSQGKSVVGMGDDDDGDCNQVFDEWMGRVLNKVQEIIKVHGSSSSGLTVSSKDYSSKVESRCNSNYGGSDDKNAGSCACQEEKSNHDNGCCSSKVDDVVDEDFYSDKDNEEEDDEDEEDDDSSAYESDYNEEKEPEVMDLEDIGNAMKSSDAAKKSAKNRELKEMVTPKQAVALKKEGYRIIGTHSAVKLCRWTKHQLRGRGGCYKHTFYGITSYQCMEATPSLACANKCKCHYETMIFNAIDYSLSSNTVAQN
jgi:Fe-S oxidoreductases